MPIVADVYEQKFADSPCFDASRLRPGMLGGVPERLADDPVGSAKLLGREFFKGGTEDAPDFEFAEVPPRVLKYLFEESSGVYVFLSGEYA